MGHKILLEAYLQSNALSLSWIVEVLKDCTIQEFDHIVDELRPVYGQLVTWLDIPDIRSKIRINRLPESP